MKKYIVCFHDAKTGRTSRFDRISADDDYTVEQYIATNGLRSFVRDGSTITLEEDETDVTREASKEFRELFEKLTDEQKDIVIRTMMAMQEAQEAKE